MKKLNEMTAKELKEIGKSLGVKNWWSTPKAKLIEEIEKLQNASEEEKTEAMENEEREKAAVDAYTKDWKSFTSRNNVSEFLEMYRSGKIIFEDGKLELVKKKPVEKQVAPTVKPVEKPVEVQKEKPIEKPVKNPVEPFIYTDLEGETWEDLDIGEMIKNWSQEKKDAFEIYFNDEFIGNGGFEAHDDNELKLWSDEWNKNHNIEEKKEGHKPTPKRGALIEFDGKAQNICAWGEELGINPNTLYGRIYKMGWSVEKAFTTKPR